MSSTTATIHETKSGPGSGSLTLAIACLLVALVGAYVPWSIRHIQATFEGFDLELPRTTVLMISIPDVMYYAAAGLGIASMIVMHGTTRSSRGRIAYYVFWILLAIAFTGLYLVAFVWPMSRLTSALAH